MVFWSPFRLQIRPFLPDEVSPSDDVASQSSIDTPDPHTIIVKLDTNTFIPQPQQQQQQQQQLRQQHSQAAADGDGGEGVVAGSSSAHGSDGRLEQLTVFTADAILGDQESMFEAIGMPLLRNALEGMNGALIAVGAKGASMRGWKGEGKITPGIGWIFFLPVCLYVCVCRHGQDVHSAGHGG